MLPGLLLLFALPAGGGLARSPPLDGGLAGSSPLGATAVLADGKAAFDMWARTTPMDNNDWTGSTFAIGLMEYYKATKAVGAADESALAYATRWAKHYDYQLYSSEGAAQIGLPPGKHIADHQLCAATYIELFKLDGNASHLDDVKAVLNAEVAAAEATSNYWSWIDALFMAMSVYSRLGNVTGAPAYASKQFMNFNASALMPADAKNRGVAEGDGKTFGFWNASDRLFYRDDRFIFSRTYWGRGNGWAISALVAALEHGEASDPHRNRYTQVYTELAAELLKLQGSDGAWHASLLDVSGYPVPETTGTASFAYGLVRHCLLFDGGCSNLLFRQLAHLNWCLQAWGVNNELLPVATYAPAVRKAWSWLTSVALHSDGLVGNCQPGGAHCVRSPLSVPPPLACQYVGISLQSLPLAIRRCHRCCAGKQLQQHINLKLLRRTVSACSEPGVTPFSDVLVNAARGRGAGVGSDSLTPRSV